MLKKGKLSLLINTTIKGLVEKSDARIVLMQQEKLLSTLI